MKRRRQKQPVKQAEHARKPERSTTTEHSPKKERSLAVTVVTVTAIIAAVVAAATLFFNVGKEVNQQRAAREDAERVKAQPSEKKPEQGETKKEEQPAVIKPTAPAEQGAVTSASPFEVRVEKTKTMKFADDLSITLTDVKHESNPVGYRAFARVFYAGHPEMGIKNAKVGYVVEDYEYRIELVKADSNSATFSVTKRP